MLGRLLLWARRNSRKAIALAVAPGLLALAFDAAVSHFAGKDFDNKLQVVPVVYGVLGAVVMSLLCIPKSRGVFAWTARIVGALGVLVGVTGSVFHMLRLFKELGGHYSASAWEGALSVAPPLLAPLGFAGVGALLFLLPSRMLLLRLRVGSPPASSSRVAHTDVGSPQVPKREDRKIA